MTSQASQRIALVTGGGRGIGAAVSEALGRRGFHVIVNYLRDSAAATRVAAAVEAAGGSALPIAADITDPRSVTSLFSGVDRLDALVVNANIQPPFAPIARMSWADFIAKISAELAAAFHVTQQALPLLGVGSQVVYVSSTAAVGTSPGGAALSSSKAALEAFASTVAAEHGPLGVAVNIVAPGATRTEASAAMIGPEVDAEYVRRSVLGRVTEPADVAATVTALAAGELPGVAGQRVVVDGGFRVLAR